jgi:chemotaxis protein histidine kinase CheA
VITIDYFSFQKLRIKMSSKLEHKLAELRITFIAELSDKLAMLTKLWSEVRTNESLDAIKKFRFEVHSLKGSSGALNFLVLSDMLGLIEEEIAPCENHINSIKSVIPFIEHHMSSMIESTIKKPNPMIVLKETSVPLDELRSQQQKKEKTRTWSYREIKIATINENKAVQLNRGT